jgi:outer membrane protein TolC
MSKIRIILTAFLVVIFLGKISFAQNTTTFSLTEYLDQVKNQNLTYTAANQNVEAYEELKKRAKLVTAVNFFASTQTGFTEQNQALQIFRYNKVYTQNTQVGLTQTSDFGLTSKLYYTLNHNTYKGLDTSNHPNPALAHSSYQSIPAIELSLPLWQNRLGSLTQASKDSVFFQNETQKLMAKSTSVSSLVAAEQSYWNLVAARKSVEIQTNALKSAEQILNYVSKREKMNLGEKGDVLQAKALFETKKLLLQQAQNDEKLAARDFNKQRYMDSAEVVEKLEDVNFNKLENFVTPTIMGDDRFDVKAQETNMKAAVANAKIDEESNKPSLNLYGSYSETQVQESNAQALSSSFDRKGRAGTVGVKLSMPINFGLTSDIRRGDIKNASAAKMNYRQKVFEQANDWQNLIQNLEVSKKNLKLAQAIEAAQKSKLENERKLLKQGRTSTYQILLFEQDYSNSQLTTIQTAYKLLSLIAQEKLYQTEIK